MNPYDAAHLLANAMKESPEYKEFKSLKDKVQQNESTKKMLKDFRKKQFTLQARQMSGQQVSEEDSKKVQELQNVLLQNPLVGPFLHAEYRLSTILNDVYKILGEAVDMDMAEDLKEISEELEKEAKELEKEPKSEPTLN